MALTSADRNSCSVASIGWRWNDFVDRYQFDLPRDPVRRTVRKITYGTRASRTWPPAAGDWAKDYRSPAIPRQQQFGDLPHRDRRRHIHRLVKHGRTGSHGRRPPPPRRRRRPQEQAGESRSAALSSRSFLEGTKSCGSFIWKRSYEDRHRTASREQPARSCRGRDKARKKPPVKEGPFSSHKVHAKSRHAPRDDHSSLCHCTAEPGCNSRRIGLVRVALDSRQLGREQGDDPILRRGLVHRNRVRRMLSRTLSDGQSSRTLRIGHRNDANAGDAAVPVSPLYQCKPVTEQCGKNTVTADLLSLQHRVQSAQ